MEIKDWISLGALVVSFFTLYYTNKNNDKQHDLQMKLQNDQNKLEQRLQKEQHEQEKDRLERESNLRKELQQDQLNFQRKRVWYERQNEVIDKISENMQGVYLNSQRLIREEVDLEDKVSLKRIADHANKTIGHININRYYIESSDIFYAVQKAINYFDKLRIDCIEGNKDEAEEIYKNLEDQMNIFLNLVGDYFIKS